MCPADNIYVPSIGLLEGRLRKVGTRRKYYDVYLGNIKWGRVMCTGTLP